MTTEYKIDPSYISHIFREAYNGKGNFMTPEFVRYGKKDKFIFEVSKGDGFAPDTTVWGLTVIELIIVDDEVARYIDDDGAEREIGFANMNWTPTRGDYAKRSDLSQACHTKRELDEAIVGLGSAA